jgi:hypothetical protein
LPGEKQLEHEKDVRLIVDQQDGMHGRRGSL